MSRTPRSLSFALLLAAGAAMLLPAPPAATGQDLEELVEGIRRFREIRERFEDREDADERERERQSRPDVRPSEPGPQGPAGLYGPNAPGRPQFDPRQRPEYGPEVSPGYFPYPNDGRRDDRLPPPANHVGHDDHGPGVSPFVNEPNFFAAATPPGQRDADAYLMRNPQLRPAEYRIDGLPGEAIVVRTVNEQAARGGADRRDAAAAAFAAQADARQALNGAYDLLRDLSYALRHAGSMAPGGSGAARGMADRADDAAVRTRSLADALRPGAVAFVPASDLDGVGGNFPAGGGETVQLADWSDERYARLRSLFDAFEATVPRVIGELSNANPYLKLRARQLDRLHLAVDAAMGRLQAARGRMRRPGQALQPGASVDRPVGGEDRLRLFALAARLTERTADLRDAVTADPLLARTSYGAREAQFGGAQPALLRGPGLSGGGNDDPIQAVRQVHDAALSLATALAGGADGRTVSAADEDFERAWSVWNRALSTAVGQTGPTPETQQALAAVDEVHHALHAAVPAAPGGGNGGRLGPVEAAAALAQSSASFARQAPQLNLRGLRRTGRQEFLAAANGLSAAAAYYSAVVRNSGFGSDAERRARTVLDAAGNEAVGGLNELADSGRRDDDAAFAQALLADLSNWRSAIR